VGRKIKRYSSRVYDGKTITEPEKFIDYIYLYRVRMHSISKCTTILQQYYKLWVYFKFQFIPYLTLVIINN
jgi:hypothetical protein